MRAHARWTWYPQAGADDELAFPKGVEIREVDVNGDWFLWAVGAEARPGVSKMT